MASQKRNERPCLDLLDGRGKAGQESSLVEKSKSRQRRVMLSCCVGWREWCWQGNPVG